MSQFERTALLLGEAVQCLERAPLEQVIVTNTIPIVPEKQIAKLKVLSVGRLLADAIQAIHCEGSVSRLFC